MNSTYANWSREELVGELEERDRLLYSQRDKVRQMADLLAEQGVIHNTPHAKWEWIRGKVA